jgi:hypothetical protein
MNTNDMNDGNDMNENHFVRHREVSRLEGFSDAVFGFALLRKQMSLAPAE